MALFQDIPDLARPDLTGEQRTQALIANSLIGLLNVARATYENLQHLLWTNSEAIPQKALNAAGADAAKLLDMIAAVRDFTERSPLSVSVAELQRWKALRELKPTEVDAKINPDGTVTVAAK